MHGKLPIPSFGFTFAFVLVAIALSQSNPPSQSDSGTVPTLDGGLGPCSADFLITDTGSKPVYNAKVKVHIAYGFLSLHKLDLEVDTNVDGKARMTGLPNRLKRGLNFEASEGDRSGVAFDDPSQTCNKQFVITVRKGGQPIE